MQIKVIITGSTGMVGEGVLLACLANPNVAEVLIINRKHLDRNDPKLKELLLPDFSRLDEFKEQLRGYDACFYCAGISSVGVTEDDFTKATYGITVPFAETLSGINPNMVFNYVSGRRTDGTEQGKVMWARVKGKTENALMNLPFKAQYNFRPGFMKPIKGQKNINTIYKVFAALYPLWITFLPNWTCTMQEVGQAMINSVLKGYPEQIIEVADIKKLAKL
ncbi:NAD-dependent epimerase/dehydratase family protein [Pedobacter punctiformis]|uniref:NAD-dependent epimerase/dehydratase family protein n=1 Tax=Pedobacter punctiformis TaxID=3004097 RepID=A0ABT4L534_9SPHI|nr:NAD-dependent epimerase/dehydratase family protein [Pedobacter sp. HCMS5-2]MCZ4243036.1 NAD-dependent epimerase/dehydratase family protein [Pedobacter sp. HCMS5-2]